MKEQEVPDQPVTEEPRFPDWTSLSQPPFGGREWFSLIVERFGFAAATLVTIAVLIILFIDTDLLLRQPEKTPSQAFVAQDHPPSNMTIPSARGLALAADDGDTTATSTVSLSIATDPDGASVFIDGEPMGETPLDAIVLAGGRHVVSVQKPNYARLDTVVTFGDSLASLQLSLRQAESSVLAIEQLKPVDQEQPTPSDQERLPRTEEAQASPPAVPDEVSAVVDEADDPETPVAGTETPVAGTETPVAGTETPVAGTETPVDRLENEDNEPDNQTPDALAVGTLKVLVKPWGTIYIDGRLHQREADVWYTTTLTPGSHRVEIEHPTLGIWKQEVVIAAGEERTLTVDFN